MRLIDYDEIRKLFGEEYNKTVILIQGGELYLDSLAKGFLEADRVIYSLPDVDAVEVVRCGECVHHSKAITPGRVICDKHAIPRNDTDFCSDGRRDKPEN